MSARVIARTTGHADIDAYIDKLGEMGAPWVSGIDDGISFAAKAGLRLLERCSAAELHARYRPGEQLGSNLFGFYFVATLEGAG